MKFRKPFKKTQPPLTRQLKGNEQLQKLCYISNIPAI